MSPLFLLQGLSKTYRTGDHYVPVLKDISFCIEQGELCAIMGASGSGKSTLMALLGFLDRPSGGNLLFRGRECGTASANALADLRNHDIGFVFQAFHLLPRLSARDNVALPLLYRGIPRSEALAAADAGLERVGLTHRRHHTPDQMSGGQRQRVAIARALVGNPSVVLADEPTGNLDSQSAQDIMAMLTALNQDTGTTVIVVTHDPTIAERCRRRLVIRDGMLDADIVSGPRLSKAGGTAQE